MFQVRPAYVPAIFVSGPRNARVGASGLVRVGTTAITAPAAPATTASDVGLYVGLPAVATGLLAFFAAGLSIPISALIGVVSGGAGYVYLNNRAPAATTKVASSAWLPGCTPPAGWVAPASWVLGNFPGTTDVPGWTPPPGWALGKALPVSFACPPGWTSTSPTTLSSSVAPSPSADESYTSLKTGVVWTIHKTPAAAEVAEYWSAWRPSVPGENLIAPGISAGSREATIAGIEALVEASSSAMTLDASYTPTLDESYTSKGIVWTIHRTPAAAEVAEFWSAWRPSVPGESLAKPVYALSTRDGVINAIDVR